MNYFQSELTKKSKKQLIGIIQALGLNSQKKKEQCIESILNKIKDIFDKNRKSHIKDDETINEIEFIILKKSRESAQFIKRCLKKIPQTERIELLRRSIQKHFVKNLMNQKQCICQNPVLSMVGSNIISCKLCNTTFHRSCLNIINKCQAFECPFCFSKNMDPLNQVQKILFQGYLKIKQKTQKIQFRLTEQQLNNNYQLQIRSIRLDGKNHYQLSWPDVGNIDLNNNKILELKPLSSNSSLKRRKDQAKTIKYKYLQKINHLVISCHSSSTYPLNKYRISFDNSHFIGIFLIKPLKIQELVLKILEKPISMQKSKSLLSSQFSQFKQLSIERVDINLKCAYSTSSIKIPARGMLCKHFKCFDLTNMICAVSFTRRWKCPICKQRAHQLIVDALLSDIIKNSQNRIKQISFQRDGEYKITYETEDSQQQSIHGESNGHPKILHMINLDSENEKDMNTTDKQLDELQDIDETNVKNRQDKIFYHYVRQQNEKNNSKTKKMEVQFQQFQYIPPKNDQNSYEKIRQSQIEELMKKKNEEIALQRQRLQSNQYLINPTNIGQNHTNNQNISLIFIPYRRLSQQPEMQIQKGNLNSFQQIVERTVNNMADGLIQSANRKKNPLLNPIQSYDKNEQKIKPSLIKTQQLDSIIILDSDEQTNENRQEKQIIAQHNLIKELGKKFSSNLTFDSAEIHTFLTMTQRFLQ